MRWQLRYQRDEFSVNAAIEKGRELPQWYTNRPTEFPGDEFYLREFFKLSTRRNYAGGPIPVDVVEQVAYAWEMNPTEAVSFSIIIRRMDDAFLEWCDDEMKRRQEQKKPGFFRKLMRRG